MYQHIKLHVENKIGTIAINCPKTANAIDPSIYAEIKDAVCGCVINDDVNVVVLTGEGKHFSAGGDGSLRNSLNQKPILRRNPFSWLGTRRRPSAGVPSR